MWVLTQITLAHLSQNKSVEPSQVYKLHQPKGVAFADKNLDLIDKSGRKCYAPTAKNRLLQEVYCRILGLATLDNSLPICRQTSAVVTGLKIFAENYAIAT
ncbi:MAG: hypothetical protein WA919_25445 [Coleofasciculaceae cyanobacterium]